MVDVSRSDEGLIEVKTDRVSCALHLATLTLELADRQGRTALSGFLPRVVSPQGTHLVEESTGDGHGKIRTRAGIATRVQAHGRLDGGLGMTLALELCDDWSGAILEVHVENRGDAPVAIDAIDPCWWNARAGGRLALPHEPGHTWFSRLGYQSDSPADFLRVERRSGTKLEPEPLPGPLTPRSAPGLFTSDCAATLCSPNRGGLTLGFVTHERFFNFVTLRSRGGEITELLASVPTPSAPLAPGESLRAERLWIGLDPPDSDGLASWAALAAREMQVESRPGASTAWSSRHSSLRERGIFALREAISATRDLDAGVELLEIDQGYAPRIGDWLEPSDGFPEGVEGACREIAAAGFDAGVWLAPFLAEPDSALLRAHPDWCLRGPDGKPDTAIELPEHGKRCLALDPAHPELQAWLAELARRLHDAGCRRIRLDWLDVGARARARAPLAPTPVEAYRSALRAMREAAPESLLLVASRAPLGPSIGLVDAMRVGPSLATPWQPGGGGWFRRSGGSDGAELGVRNLLARASLGALFRLDPDCLLLRDSQNPLRGNELYTAACVALLSGGWITFSGWIRDFGVEHCALLRSLLPALGRVPESGTPIRGSDTRLVQRFPDGSALVLIPNLGPRAQSFEIDLEALGMPGPQHVWDVRAQASRGVHSDRWSSDKLAPHDALLLRLTPADGRARVIGSSLHLTAGALEVQRLSPEPDGTLALRARQPGARQGSIALAPASGPPLQIGVGFVDGIELRALSIEL